MKGTHYQTLGLPTFASLNEVKQAYRKLAKQFHPDVNPSGKEAFTRITAAYEILGDASRKYIYDSRLKQELRQNHAVKKTPGKPVNTSEQELRRRQYYQQHYKNHYQQQRQTRQQQQPKTYNEYKYILFATPIAVTLVLLILSLYQNSTLPDSSVINSATAPHTLNNGEFPYQSYFGSPVYNTTASRQIVLNNTNGQDIICLVFSKQGFRRGCYLRQKYSATITQLPNDTLMIRYMSGSNWCASCKIQTQNQTIMGRFKNQPRFFETVIPPNSTGIIDNVMLSETHPEISSESFFTKVGNTN